MQSHITHLLYFALTLTLSTVPCAQSSAQDFSDSSPYQVVRIIDGDTVVLLMDGEQITTRLIGVDTPETVHPQKPVEYYGNEASWFTRNLLLGESVFLKYGQERKDRFGRLLAYLYRVPDRLFVNQEITRQGYGHAYTSFPFKYLETFRAYERKARDSKKGLWDQERSFSARKIGETKKFQKDPTRKTGKKYHLPGCRYLSKGQSLISLTSARLKYSACSVCKPPE